MFKPASLPYGKLPKGYTEFLLLIAEKLCITLLCAIVPAQGTHFTLPEVLCGIFLSPSGDCYPPAALFL